MTNAERNRKKRQRQERQRDRMLRELNFYKNNTFAEEDQETVARKIRILERDLEHNGVPNTYRQTRGTRRGTDQHG